MRLRLSVHGLRNNRIFHLVAIDGRRRRDGKPVELLGIYQPHLKPGEDKKVVEWSVDRIRYWLQVGATPSKSVVKLLELVGCAVLNVPLSTYVFLGQGNILKPGHPYERTIIPKDRSLESAEPAPTTQTAQS